MNSILYTSIDFQHLQKANLYVQSKLVWNMTALNSRGKESVK